MTLLSVLFFATALLYSSVGFGGGSTYNALLVIFDVPYQVLPATALVCNIIVVTGGVWHFQRRGYVQAAKYIPWLVGSMPAAWLGGFLSLPEKTFTLILATALLLSAFCLLYPVKEKAQKPRHLPNWQAVCFGAVLGFVAGVTGIGGGIYLAPLLYFIRFGHSRHIAAFCSVFILLNSGAGLVGHMSKQGAVSLIQAVAVYWPLFVAVMVGGQLGAWLGSAKLSVRHMRMITGLLVLYVALRLFAEQFATTAL